MWQYEMVSIDVKDTDESMNFINEFLKLQSEEECHLEQVVPLKWVTDDEYTEVIKYLFVFKYRTTEPNDSTETEPD